MPVDDDDDDDDDACTKCCQNCPQPILPLPYHIWINAGC